MQTETITAGKHLKSGSFGASLCNFLGILMILAVIVTCLPLTIPRLMGYEIFHVESGSMEPEIPIGSVVYVAPSAPEDLKPGDVITFYKDQTIVTHRLQENRVVEGEFVTKGDANPMDDIDAVPYGALIGKVTYHVPWMGMLLNIYTSDAGKIYVIVFAACGIMFNVLAGMLRRRKREKILARLLGEQEARIERLKNHIIEINAAQESDEIRIPERKRSKGLTVAMSILLVIFLAAAGCTLYVMHKYKVSDEINADAADRFTSRNSAGSGGTQTDDEEPDVSGRQADDEEQGVSADSGSGQETGERNRTRAGKLSWFRRLSGYAPEATEYELLCLQAEKEKAPFTVNFDELKKVNDEVAAWLYCEDTNINYVVAQGKDNDYYLDHAYDGSYSGGGTIMVDADNSEKFQDICTIIYGHHMKVGTMFARLDRWNDQEFYETHSVMWLLTPEQDYKILVMTGNTISAYSDHYQIHKEHSEEFEALINEALAGSDIQSGMHYLPDAKYVLLSTCNWTYENARRVVYGMLVPVGSAGGEPLKKAALQSEVSGNTTQEGTDN